MSLLVPALASARSAAPAARALDPEQLYQQRDEADRAARRQAASDALTAQLLAEVQAKSGGATVVDYRFQTNCGWTERYCSQIYATMSNGLVCKVYYTYRGSELRFDTHCL